MTVPVTLLDANVLVSLASPEHVHHPRALSYVERSLTSSDWLFATCPTVQGALVRLLYRAGSSPADAVAVLRGLLDHPRHQQWLDDITYAEVDLAHVLGHRQVTDAYLAQLARVHGGRLATFDRGLAQAAPDVVELLPA